MTQHEAEEYNHLLINEVIKDVKQRLIKTNRYVKNNNLTLSSLHFGNNQHSMDKNFIRIK